MVVTALDWIVVAVYLSALVIIGVSSVRAVRSSDDFAVAGRRVAWPVLFATVAASFLGGGSSMGNAGNVFTDGYVFMFAFLAFSLQTLLVGGFVAHRLRRYEAAQTVGDVMDIHYGRWARLATGILSLAVCTGILGGQVLAVGALVDVVFGVEPLVGTLVGMGVVLLYSTFGGIWADIQTDVLQFVILGVFLPVALVIGVVRAGGPAELIASVPTGHMSLLGDWTLLAFVGVFVAFLLGETLTPPFAQRAFAASSPRDSRRAYLATGIFTVGFYFVTASIGLVALALFPRAEPDQAMVTVVTHLLPIGVTGLVLAALFAVIMSTADSYLNSTAVVFVKDIWVPFVRPQADDRQRLFVQRAVTVLVGAGAVGFALSAPSIIDAFLLAFHLWAPTVVLPLLAAVVWRVHSRSAGLAAILSGGAATAVWQWVLDEPFGVSGLLAGVIVNGIVFASVHAFAPRQRELAEAPA